MRLDYINASPGGVKALGGVYAYVAQSGLDDTLIELVYLRVSQINGCAFCLDMHTTSLIKKGVTPTKLALVQAWHEAGPVFSAREKAALAWAETVTRVADTHVPDQDFSAAAAVFSDKELSDLTIAIGLMNAYNRLAISFRRAPDSALAAKGSIAA
jgi:AhpD family alkylhydroperoxidase